MDEIEEFPVSLGEGDILEPMMQIPPELPVLPLRDIVIYPFMIVPLFVSRDRSVKAVETALSENRMILLVSQKDLNKEEPEQNDLYTVGTVAIIMRMLKLPDGRIRILIQGLSRCQVDSVDGGGSYVKANVTPISEPLAPENSLEVEALVRNVRGSMERAASLGKNISPEVLAIIANLDDAGRLADLSASNLELKVEDAQSVLDIHNPVPRLRRVNDLLSKEIDVLTVQQEINTQARADIDRSQREYFLRQQLKAIQMELGEGNELYEEIELYRDKILKAKMPENAEEEALRQLKKLERMHPDTAETATLRNWLDIMTELPWSVASTDNLNLKKAEKILDEDHYGLERVKERIVESLAVRKLLEKPKGSILCLVGPPGVGKTSLGRSVARALNRKFSRLSLGGLHDEAEIRGHRRTYVGAMPGRIIQAIQQVGTNNPLIMLDEIDKVGSDFRGDPSSALLEVLDPEQNSTFRDNYLGITFDLSNVMFMTTANVLETIQPALRDRMEIISLSGYTEEEKYEIAKRHLIPKQVEENGLKKTDIKFDKKAVVRIIGEYTQEAGLRHLEREIGKVCRKVARKKAELESEYTQSHITADNLAEYLRAPRIFNEGALKKDTIGTVTGLAWTAVGGDILFIEALMTKGKGRLQLTGQLGDVMQESAQAAFSYAKARAKDLGISAETLEGYDIHIHLPEGAIPKDGPSAGITMATAMVSVLAQRPVRKEVAMTGEITLRGNVLPIGGVKEKLLAARRAKIKTVIMPAPNKRDLEDMPQEILDDLTFIFVENVLEVFDAALRKSTIKESANSGSKTKGI
ncbi:MAG TPA: endopeptidase La [Pyrinomonadaceae bacterium]|nr:endopeptidase La [Chloracidobacterium sp.]MBK9437176.1 endopeptidase La [Chloracidobacterium sp.]MBL0239848.1 endopeptidase La [Chloracidobacterium sp.]HQY68671.1 endopeptidase La [Pyrinomonadaceae bacterium]